MGLSIEKLERILSELGCYPLTYYYYRDYLRYVECIYEKTKDLFLLFVTDDYKFKIETNEKTIRLKRIRDNDVKEIMEKYTKEEDKLETSKIYGAQISVMNTDDKPKVIEENLEESYNINLDLQSNTNERFSIQEIKRQCRRLSMAIEGTKYRLCVISNNYMVIPRKEDDVIFELKHVQKSKARKIYVIIDIETILSEIKILDSINKIYDGFVEILGKNIIMNKKKLEEFKNSDISTENVIEIVDKINRYSSYIQEFNDILTHKEDEEQAVQEKITALRNKPKYGVNQDIKDAPMMLELDEKLLKIRTEKKGHIEQIIELKRKQRNNVLVLDKILFDNIMLLSTIKYNLSELKLLK